MSSARKGQPKTQHHTGDPLDVTGRAQYPEKVSAPGTSEDNFHWSGSDHPSSEDEHGPRAV